jgi:hypothetical protein
MPHEISSRDRTAGFVEEPDAVPRAAKGKLLGRGRLWGSLGRRPAFDQKLALVVLARPE